MHRSVKNDSTCTSTQMYQESNAVEYTELDGSFFICPVFLPTKYPPKWPKQFSCCSYEKLHAKGYKRLSMIRADYDVSNSNHFFRGFFPCTVVRQRLTHFTCSQNFENVSIFESNIFSSRRESTVIGT